VIDEAWQRTRKTLALLDDADLVLVAAALNRMHVFAADEQRVAMAAAFRRLHELALLYRLMGKTEELGGEDVG